MTLDIFMMLQVLLIMVSLLFLVNIFEYSLGSEYGKWLLTDSWKNCYEAENMLQNQGLYFVIRALFVTYGTLCIKLYVVILQI